MHPVLAKTFGGLSPACYVRHALFGLLFPGLLYMASGSRTFPPAVWAFALACSVLYPYARFAYEGVVGYVVGRNAFFGSATVLLLTKFATMGCCWLFAPVIAPLGLAWLYWRHRDADR